MKVAIIQVRGPLKTRPKVKSTLNKLSLPRKNSCVIVDNVPEIKGMLIKVQSYVTWGEIDTDTMKLLLEKRGKLPGGKHLDEVYLQDKVKKNFEQFAKDLVEGKAKIKDVPGLKKFFRLTPPKGGFEDKGIKKPFSLGGALGYRGNKINDLIKRMI